MWRFGVPAYAVGLGAYLTIGELPKHLGENPDDLRYVIVGSLGILGLVALAGWHALWLLPVATIGFAWIFESYFWTRPPEVGEGLDYLALHPTSVMWLMPLAVPFAEILAALREVALERRRWGS